MGQRYMKLEREISQLRDSMNKLAETVLQLSDPQLVTISQKLDQKLNELFRKKIG